MSHWGCSAETHPHVVIVACLRGGTEAGGYFLSADVLSALQRGKCSGVE